MKNKKALAFFLLLVFPASQANAYWVWSPKEGKFVNAEGATQDSAEEQFDYAMKLYREKNLDGAKDKFKEILKKYPNSPKAPESEYRLGMIFEEKGDYLKAFKVYKSLVETYPQSERFNEVIEREFRIGNVFLSGRKAKLAGLEILPSLPKAVDVFSHIVKNAPYSDFGDKAQYQLGLAYKKWKHYGEAVEAFQAIIDQYPQSELVSQARYEVAENSFLRSASNTRDQRALDEASKQVTRFLDRYPDANTAEKATQIRQEIDEKNAEKNYRIGLYYEGDNYVESALIYYQDVVTRYPETQWGKKAAQKLQSLKEPAKYVSQQQTALDEQEHALENKLKSLEAGKDEVEKDITRRSLERLKKHKKTLEKDKKDTMGRRKGDLVRREKELKQKYKNLEAKKKLLKKNPSEDLKNAIGRWESSLDKEKSELASERAQLEGWNKELGIRDKVDMSFLPFVGPGPTELQKVQSIEAKRFYKISEKKKNILEEKETLYKHYSEVSTILQQPVVSGPAASASAAAPVSPDKLKSLQEENARLESELKEKTALYEKHYGKSALAAITGGFKKSIDVLNPFDDSKPMDAQQLLEHQMHLKEQIAAEQNLIQTLSQALDSQLALEEQKRLMEQLQKKEKADPKELRKQTRALERQIRGGYEEIEARHKHKQQLLKQLDQELKTRESQDPAIIQITRKVSSPVVGAGRLAKAFFVGLPHEDEQLTKAAAKSQDTSAIKKLEEQIRDESLLMEAKNQEITNQRKELEILKAQGSISGGYKFRAVFIDVPYMFFDEAMDSAKRLIPKKDREAMLVNRVHNETEKLEKLKAQLKGVDEKISKLPKEAGAKAEVKEAEPAKAENKAESGEKVAPKEVLQKEIETLHTKLELQANEAKEQVLASGVKDGKKITPVTDSKQAKKLSKELREIQESLADLIRKESKLEKEEKSILEKRISRIEKEMKKNHSQAVSQDLLTEKERMEDRLSQLETRQDFLTQELKRFEPLETGK